MKDFLDGFPICLHSPIKIKLYKPRKLFPVVNRNQLECVMQLGVKDDDFNVDA